MAKRIRYDGQQDKCMKINLEAPFLVLLEVREGTKSAKIARCKKLTAKVYSRLFIAGFLQLKRAFLSKLPLNFLKLKNYFNFYVLLCTLIHSNARNRLQTVSNQIL